MYQADDPIEGFRAAIRENLVNIANGQGHKEFNPEQDCPAWIWWLEQDTPTVQAFVDRVLEAHAANELEPSWISNFLLAAWTLIDPTLREKITKLTIEDYAVIVALFCEGFTEAEKEHLREECLIRAHERPSIKVALREKLN